MTEQISVPLCIQGKHCAERERVENLLSLTGEETIETHMALVKPICLEDQANFLEAGCPYNVARAAAHAQQLANLSLQFETPIEGAQNA